MDDNETKSITFTALSYSLSQILHVLNQTGENVSNVSITGGATIVYTNTAGIATITRTNLTTDANNLPLANYTTNLTLAGTNIQTLNTSITSVAGTNTEKLLNIVQEYEQWLYGTSTSPNGALVQVWKNGTAVQSATVANNAYATADISNGSVKYSQNFMVFRKRAEEITNPADTNYAQVSKFDGIVDFARLQLTNIPDTLYEYVAKAKVAVPTDLIPTYGDSINITHNIMRYMMGGSNGSATIKFIPRTGAETLYMFQMTFNETTGAPIDQTQLDRAKTELDKVLAIYKLNNGIKLIDYKFSLINSYTDPKWLEAQARDNYDNMAYTTFWSGNAYNGIGRTLTYSTNGHSRIKNSKSQFNIGNTTGIINTEIYQQFTNNMDPSQNTAPWTYDGTNSSITDFGKTMARLIYLLNQGTSTGSITNE